ncbi:toll-like receptor 4 [Octopus vulgaris]|nr:toll-like receptor 4 [Octopus vulgaris]
MIRENYSYKRLTPDEYIYDAFVIYADENRDFALNYLIPELEEKENLRLNIHHRDFPVGKLISENILSAIQSSRKCIILLSRYFVESKWCMFEYNLAKMEYIHTERNIVIIVVLEQVPHRQLPLPILEQIKNQSYIEFPKENEIAQEMFWKNLKHSIQLKD